MALMDLKSDLSWYGTKPPTTQYFTNTDAIGFSANKQQHQTEFIGVQGDIGSMRYEHTGITGIANLGIVDAFENTHQKGFTTNIMPIGESRPGSLFEGITGDVGALSFDGNTSLFGNIINNIRDDATEFESYTPGVGSYGTKFAYNDAGTFVATADKAKGFSNDGVTVVNQIGRTSADSFATDDVSFSSRGIASRKSQLGSGTLFAVGQHEFDITRTGFHNDKKYGDLYNRQSNDGLANTYTANSPIDDMYNKFNLREDAHQLGYINYPLNLRGIQRKGKSDPQRYGLGGGAFDIPRGGLLTSVTRTVIDVARIGKYLVSPHGLGFIAKQIGYQLMNPQADTRLWNPLSLGSIAPIVHINRHIGSGLKDLAEKLGAIGTTSRLEKLNNETNPAGDQGSRLDPYSNKFETLSTKIGGPGSILGIGGTNYLQVVDTSIDGQLFPAIGSKAEFDNNILTNIADRRFFVEQKAGPAFTQYTYYTYQKRVSSPFSDSAWSREQIDAGDNYRTTINDENDYNVRVNHTSLKKMMLKDGADETDENRPWSLAQTKEYRTSPEGEDTFAIGSAAGKATNQKWSDYEKLAYTNSQKYQEGSTVEQLDERTTTTGETDNIKKDSLRKKLTNFTTGDSVTSGEEGEEQKSTYTVNQKPKDITPEREIAVGIRTVTDGIVSFSPGKKKFSELVEGEYGNKTPGESPTGDQRYFGPEKIASTTDTEEGSIAKLADADGLRNDSFVPLAGILKRATPAASTVGEDGTETEIPVSSIGYYKTLAYGDIKRDNYRSFSGDTKGAFGGTKYSSTTTLTGKYGFKDYKIDRSTIEEQVDDINSIDNLSYYPQGDTAAKDLIKFKFTPMRTTDKISVTDGIIFRAYIDSISDSFAPGWNSNQDQGRADSKIMYDGWERTISLNFKVVVHSKGELEIVYKKLDELAKLTYPVYVSSGFTGTYVKVTIGDLYSGIPMYVTDLGYEWDNETPWEIDSGKQVPLYTNVNMTLGWIGIQRPEYNGNVFSLNGVT